MFSRLAWLALICACGACGRAAEPNKPVMPAVHASTLGREYVAPGADGYGRAGELRFLEICLGAEPSERLPMVVVIHGLGDRPGRHWLDLVQLKSPVRIILPEAPTPYMDGFSWFEFRADDLDEKRLARGIAAAEAKLANLLQVLSAKRPTLGRPLLTGFSQGGMLSFALALRHPELIALAIPVSGMLPQPLWPEKKARASVTIRALHGTADQVVDYAAGKKLVTHLQTLGYDATLTSFDGVAHNIDASMGKLVKETLAKALVGS